MRKQLIIIIYLSFFSLRLLGQENNSLVPGLVADKSSKQPVEFAMVQLLKKADSTIVTDHKGKFVLDNIAPGNYTLRISLIGYNKILMPLSVVKQKEHIGIVEIGVLSKNMNEVVAASGKLLLNTSIDRKVYNVTQDIMAQSGSASDILKNINRCIEQEMQELFT
jgi:hypothetical protein